MTAKKETVVLVSPTTTDGKKSKEEKKNRTTNGDDSSPCRRHWQVAEQQEQQEVGRRRKDPWRIAMSMFACCSLVGVLVFAVCSLKNHHRRHHHSSNNIAADDATVISAVLVQNQASSSSIGEQSTSRSVASASDSGGAASASTTLLARLFSSLSSSSSSPPPASTTFANNDGDGGAREEKGGGRAQDFSSDTTNNKTSTTTTKVPPPQQQQRRRRPQPEEREEVTSDDTGGDSSATTTGGNEQCTKQSSISGRRLVDAHGSYYYYTMDELYALLRQVDDDVRNNRDGGRRWVRPELLPPLRTEKEQQRLEEQEQEEARQEDTEEDQEEKEAQEEEEEEEMMIHPYRGYDEYLEQKETTPTSDGISGPETTFKQKKKEIKKKQPKRFITVKRKEQPPMVWEEEWKELQRNTAAQDIRPEVDYTDHTMYEYPDVEDAIRQAATEDPPAVAFTEGDTGLYEYSNNYYPSLERLGDMLRRWPTDRDYPIDDDNVITETLYHFNYSNITQRHAAERYRDIAKVPFKVYDVPDLTRAGLLWTDDYVSQQFDQQQAGSSSGTANDNGSDNHDVVVDDEDKKEEDRDDNHTSSTGGSKKKRIMMSGHAEESPNNFFAYYKRNKWNLTLHGLAPVRTNDWTYRKWSQHARYADAVRLSTDKPHFYWQSGTKEDERYYYRSEQSFVSRDLKFFSQTVDNFFVFDVDSSKGIQCRFGERGVTTANHYDSGRNMVAMITGAKRYILAPPNQCGKLGIGTDRESHIFRHSHLNLAHLSDDDIVGTNDKNSNQIMMSDELERAWLRRASDGMAVETVVKAGEVLYIPSHWFHYIISLQKSAQCNSRSGMDREGTARFGGLEDVETCR